jgi:hypothetical protein
MKMKKLSVTLLGQAVAALNDPNKPYIFSTEKEAAELIKAGYVEVNPTIKDDKGNVAVRATEAGKAAAGATAGASAPATETKPVFNIVKNVALPKIARAGGGGGRESKYPIADMEPGDSFFIVATPDMKSPSKSFGSLVAAANKKYNKADDFRRFTTRSVTGDAWGQPGVKGVAIFRLPAEDEAKAKAAEFPAA